MKTPLRNLKARRFLCGAAAIYVFATPAPADLERSMIGTGGRVTAGGGVSLSYSVGEAFIGAGSSGSSVLSAGYQQPGGYDFWSTAHGLTTGPLADPDHDGVPNLLEYAFGTDPLNPASRPHVQFSIGVDGKLYVTIQKNPAATGLTWGAEGSVDLINWTGASISIALNSATTFTALFTGNAPGFIRLRISKSGSE